MNVFCRLTIALHAGGSVDSISKQAVARHLQTDHTRHHWACNTSNTLVDMSGPLVVMRGRNCECKR